MEFRAIIAGPLVIVAKTPLAARRATSYSERLRLGIAVIHGEAKGEDVDPNSYYMRTQARLESGDPRYDWVNETLFVGAGARLKNKVALSLYALV